MIEHRNTTATVRLVLKACDAAGVDTDELLRLADIDRGTAENPDGEVTFNQMRSFWQHAFRLSKDPFLGMHATEHLQVGDYKCLDYLTLNAPSVGGSLSNFCRYLPLINTWINLKAEEADNGWVITMSPNAGVIPPHSYELVFSIFTQRMRQLTQDSWSPQEIHFPFSSPDNAAPHQQFFTTTIHYDAPVAEFIVSQEDWDTKLENSDQQLLKVMDDHARMIMSQRPIPEDFVGEVRRQIVRELHGGEANKENIAEQLHMSPRTLQRRLDNNGIAYADLLDEVRQELAKTKLQNSDLSLAEIGFLLGFSEQSSFNRAFKRWTGKTPREYRKAVRLGEFSLTVS